MNKQNKNLDLFVQNVRSLAHTKPFNSSKNTEVNEHRNYLDAEKVKSNNQLLGNTLSSGRMSCNETKELNLQHP